MRKFWSIRNARKNWAKNYIYPLDIMTNEFQNNIKKAFAPSRYKTLNYHVSKLVILEMQEFIVG